MAVYLIRAGTLGPVKIGSAIDPIARMAGLQTAHWETLILVRQWEGGETEERKLHERFAENRLVREWFAFSQLMMGPVGLVVIQLPSEVLADMAMPSQDGSKLDAFMELSEIIKAAGGASKLAKALGVQHSTPLRWKSVPSHHVPAVSALTLIPRHLIRADLYEAPSLSVDAA